MVSRAGQVLLGLLGFATISVVGAQAEDSASPMQFWLQERANPPAERNQAPHPVFRPRHTHAAARSEHRAPVQAQAAAKPDFVVAVFGDGFGFDAARGLADLYAGDKRAEVVDETSDGSSLSAAALPAWGDELTAATRQAGRVDAAVMMLGSADLQPITDEHGVLVAPDTPAWREVYADRIRRTAAVFRDRKVPLIWVGLPIVRDDDLARRYAGLNTMVRESASAAGFTYIDSWAAFADENGHFATIGPDETGQAAKLRREDGRRLTRAGARKLASFIEPELKRLEDKAEAAARLAAIGTTDAEVFDQALSIDINAQIRREAGLPPLPESDQGKDGPVVELTAAPSAQNGRLVSADARVALTASAEAVLTSGLMPLPRPGRTDDFSWPRP